MEQEFERDGVDNVFFIESNVDPTDPNGTQQAPNTRTRMNRLREVIPSASTLPFMIAQGGKFANQAGAPGGTSPDAWRGLFNDWISEGEAMAPTMKVDAWFKRSALNKVTVTVDVENTGKDVFDPWENGGSLGIIGYEHNDPEAIHLHKLMRIIDWMDFEDVVEPGQKVRLESEFTTEVATDFGKLQMVAMVEFETDEGRDYAGAVKAIMGDPPIVETPEPVAPVMSCGMTPASTALYIGDSVTLTTLVRADGKAAPDAEVTIVVDSGPHAGETITGTSDATGEVKLTFTGATEGSDMIKAEGDYLAEGFPDALTFDCGSSTIEWTERPSNPDPDPPTPAAKFYNYMPLVLANHEL